MSYQWQWNGQNLSGETNDDLTVTNLSGSYRMIAVNALGSVTSRVARLGYPGPPLNTNLDAALNATNMSWTTYAYNRQQKQGYGLWFAENEVTHDGVAAAQSGGITNYEQSILQTSVTGPGTLKFWWRVSSEQDFDFLNFWLDNTSPVRISGETDWWQVSVTLSAGTHSLRWIYSKDESVSAGLDAGWVDEVTFTPAPIILFAPQFGADGTFSFGVGSGGQEVPPVTSSNLEVQASTNLTDWTALPGSLTLTNNSLRLRDADAPNFPRRFYRVVEH